MRIEMLCENKIRLMLDAQDLCDYGLTFEEIDYDRPATQRAFRDMMTRVRKDVGFQSEGCRLLVEARATDEGGCVMVVTRQPLTRRGRERTGSRREGRVVYRLEQSDDLLDALSLLRRQQEESLRGYSLDGYYYLAVGAETAAGRILREFGSECPARTETMLEQKGRRLAL